MIQVRPKTKAIATTIFLVLFGIFCLIYKISDWRESLPLVLFYTVITVNTFYSISLFSGMTSMFSRAHNVFDFSLVVNYAFLAWNFNNPLNFVFFDLILFIIASAKYTSMLNIAPHPKLLKRKILIDISGIALAAITLIGIVFGLPEISLWFMATSLTIANIYWLFIKPMYRLD